MFSAGDARVALKTGSKNEPPIDTRNLRVNPETLPHWYGFYPRHHSPAIDAGNWLTSPACFVVTPLLSHFLNNKLFRITGYNHFGPIKRSRWRISSNSSSFLKQHLAERATTHVQQAFIGDNLLLHLAESSFHRA